MRYFTYAEIIELHVMILLRDTKNDKFCFHNSG